MRHRITPENMERGIANAMKDRPKVRRIARNVYGCTCRGKCKRGSEHTIVFTQLPAGLFAECLECKSDELKPVVCRHICAVFPLFTHCQSWESIKTVVDSSAMIQNATLVRSHDKGESVRGIRI